MEKSPDDDRELVHALLRAGARLEGRLDRALSSIKGVSFSEYQLLRALEHAHEQTATRADLARAVGLTPSGVTRALRPLEKLRFVKTAKDRRDARRSLPTLTAQGSELVADASGVARDAIADSPPIQALTATDRKRIVAFLESLARA